MDHRRWLALKEMGADKIRCEVRAFDDELDEWETLIECNKQREKTRIQKANEIGKLRVIKEEKARRKMKASGSLGGQPAHKPTFYPPPNSAEGRDDEEVKPVSVTSIDTSNEIAKMQDIRRQKQEKERIEQPSW